MPTNESVHGIERTLAKTLVGMITRFVANATASTCGLYANSLSGRERKAGGYLQLLEAAAQANPIGELYLITDNFSSHKSPPIREWLENHPRVKQVFIPVGACWLKLQEAWWRLFR